MRQLAKLLLMVWVGLALWIRWQIAAQDPLWIDELHSSWVISGAWNEIPLRAAAGNQSPWFFFLIRLPVEFIGQSPITLRLAPLVGGSILVLVAGAWVYRHTQSLWATGATVTWIGFDEVFLFYSTEARPYGLLQLLVAGLAMQMMTLRGGKGAASVDWTLVGTAGALSAFHPVGGVIAGIAGLILVSLPAKGTADRRTGSAALVVIAAVAWTNPALNHLFARREQWFDMASGWDLEIQLLFLALGVWAIPECLSLVQRRFWFGVPRGTVFGGPKGKAQAPADRYSKPGSMFSDRALESPCDRNGCPSRILELDRVRLLLMFWLSAVAFMGLGRLEWLPLAQLRYLSAIWPLAGLALGLNLEKIPDLRLRGILVCGLPVILMLGPSWVRLPVGQSIANCPVWNGLTRPGEIFVFRYESWDRVWERLNQLMASEPQRYRVCLLPNLLEERWLAKSEGSQRSALLDYLKFPLAGLYRISDYEVGQTLWPPHLELGQTGSDPGRHDWLIVIRASPSDADLIVKEIQSELARFAAYRTVLVHIHQGDLQLIELRRE